MDNATLNNLVADLRTTVQTGSATVALAAVGERLECLQGELEVLPPNADVRPLCRRDLTEGVIALMALLLDPESGYDDPLQNSLYACAAIASTIVTRAPSPALLRPALPSLLASLMNMLEYEGNHPDVRQYAGSILGDLADRGTVPEPVRAPCLASLAAGAAAAAPAPAPARPHPRPRPGHARRRAYAPALARPAPPRAGGR